MLDKKTEEFANMCYEIEKLVNAGVAEGEAKGRTKMILGIMSANGVDFAAAAKMAGCSQEEVAALKPIVQTLLEAKEN